MAPGRDNGAHGMTYGAPLGPGRTMRVPPTYTKARPQQSTCMRTPPIRIMNTGGGCIGGAGVEVRYSSDGNAHPPAQLGLCGKGPVSVMHNADTPRLDAH